MGYVEDLQAKRAADAQRWEEQDSDLCQLCHAYGADKRSLLISCFYVIKEVIPEAIDLHAVANEHVKGRGYYLRICKSCRGRLLGMLETWRNECVALRDVPKDHDGYPDGEDTDGLIPMRVNGVTVMLTPEGYERRQRKETEGEHTA